MSLYTENPSDAELVQLGIDSFANRLFKAGPGIVRIYDPVTNTAFVQPAVKHAMPTEDGGRVFEDLPEIPFVPVIFPRAGGFVMRTPVAPGDSVLLVYCDSSLAEWRQGGGTAEPEDARRHSIGWPVAIPGFFPDSSPMSAIDGAAAALQMIIGQDGGSQLRIGPTGIELAPSGVTPAMPLALAPPLVSYLALVQASLVAIQATLVSLQSVPTIVAVTATGTATTASGTAVTAATNGAVTMASSTPSTLARSV
jgi:hypothetical protein